MKKVYESKINCVSESAEQITLYALDSQEEREELDELTHGELCDALGVFDQMGYEVAPGAIYHTYNFEITDAFLIVKETVARNV